MPPEHSPSSSDQGSYAEFGVKFFEHAITEGRILGALGGIAGEPINVGPMGVGPGRKARVTATGQVGEATAQRIMTAGVAFRLTIPVALELKLDLRLDQHTFAGMVTIVLILTARAADPLRIVIDIDPPSSRDITVDLRADSVRGEVLQRAVGVDRELARFVSRYVANEIEKPHVIAARDIDIAARIDAAWAP